MDDNNLKDTLITMGVVGIVLHLWSENDRLEMERRDAELARVLGISKEQLLKDRQKRETDRKLEEAHIKRMQSIGWLFSATPVRAKIYWKYINRYMWDEGLTERQALKKLAEFLKARFKRRRNLKHRWQVRKRAKKLPLALSTFRLMTTTKPDDPRRLALKQRQREAYAKERGWEFY